MLKNLLINSFVFFTTLLILGACSPSIRLSKLIDKHPELSATTTIEKNILITDYDTFFIPGSKIDTSIILLHDSIFLSNGALSISLKKKADNSYKILSLFKPDTIIKREIISYKIVDTIAIIKLKDISPAEKKKYRKQGAQIAGLIALLILIAGLIIKNYKKIVSWLSII